MPLEHRLRVGEERPLSGNDAAEKYGRKATTDAEGPFTTVKGPSETVHADHQMDKARGDTGPSTEDLTRGGGESHRLFCV
jgi:hypothetical protein